ncbi:general secretion pathway protein I [Vibrio cincinnatiensis]|jgi:general secretion pathway protein I|uniref:Type II secretion system protein I n=1 Tax=Vibrio cincinnatiensis DSM 19608 TaxID=1123491 RepID=A0A1T4RT21_VIBCI|nr:general secretion pathway protein I [Vibrio cincinnatiensis DSM 19608]SUP47423.1 general secretion pathway protein I [Vibrio cincinnatiensis]
MIKHKFGFTLLEVLIALAIFSTAAISVIRAVTQHINTISYLEEKTFAAMVADNQMAKVHLNAKLAAQSEGHEELAGRTWYWRVSPVKTSNTILAAFDVSVAAEAKTSPIITVRSYVAK